MTKFIALHNAGNDHEEFFVNPEKIESFKVYDPFKGLNHSKGTTITMASGQMFNVAESLEDILKILES